VSLVTVCVVLCVTSIQIEQNTVVCVRWFILCIMLQILVFIMIVTDSILTRLLIWLVFT